MSSELALRPMSTSQVLDRMFQLYRSHFVVLAGIGLLLPGLSTLLQLAFIPLGFPPRAGNAASPETFLLPFLGFFACYAVVYTVGYALAGGATVYGVAKLHLGETATIGQAYRQVFSRFWKIVGIVIVTSLVTGTVIFLGEIVSLVIVAVIIGSTRIFANYGPATPVIAVIGVIWAFGVFLAAVVGGVFFYCKFALAVPACVLEQMPVFKAMGRSWSLTKGAVWRLILVFLLTWVAGAGLALIMNVPSWLYNLVFHGKSFLILTILQVTGSFIAGVLANPIATISIALIYYDQRVRKEAFDLQVMMAALGEPAAQQAAGAAPGI